jgi:hypothetical protein
MQINTTVRSNYRKLDETYRLACLGRMLHVFMLVPVGAGRVSDGVDHAQGG